MDIQALISRAIAPLGRRLRLMVARAVITAIDDSGKIQSAQVKLLDGEVREGVEILNQYGFSSVPPGEPEGLYFSVGGDRDHGVMAAVADRAFRFKNLAPGEVAIYTDEDATDGKHHIIFKRGQEIHLIAGTSSIVMTPESVTIETPTLIVKASNKARFETPVFETTGTITDLCDSEGRSMSGMRGIFNAHTHAEHDAGGPTAAPGQAM
jgi:phage baseplate assembly protein V